MQTEKKEHPAAAATATVAGEKPPSFCDRLQRAFHSRPAFRPLRRLGVGRQDGGGGGALGTEEPPTVHGTNAAATHAAGGQPKPVPSPADHAPAPIVLPPAVKPAAKPIGTAAPAPIVLPSAPSPAAKPSAPPPRHHGHAPATTASAPAAAAKTKVAKTTTPPPGIPVPVPPPAAAAATGTPAAADGKDGGGESKEQQSKAKSRVSSRVRKAFSSK
uniref:Uncharacterized protein n=1 Tax=Leersia perrieri TaxID=77586 RepID=A0A0D9VU82_9ORYZ